MHSSRENLLMLATSQGVFAALMTTQHLGEAVKHGGYIARTRQCDAFETGFEWARQQQKDLDRWDKAKGNENPVNTLCDVVLSELNVSHPSEVTVDSLKRALKGFLDAH